MTKPVTLSNEAYEALKKIKGKDMSFSDVVLKLVKQSMGTHDFNKFAGTLKAQASELEKFKLQIEEDRERNVENM
ncbi:MAG: antitoxin VapB family protein [Thermoplasmataceae archaeon]|jgi:predicted CopG family antitoxin|nr:MAG: hypothetical protein AMDU2_EPLC00006G0483 [Thermoplasmatales archaeon E-plasma]